MPQSPYAIAKLAARWFATTEIVMGFMVAVVYFLIMGKKGRAFCYTKNNKVDGEFMHWMEASGLKERNQLKRKKM